MLAPLGWLAWLVPVALLTLWPWLRARREAKARVVAALTTLGAPTAPTEDGAVVTLEGRLEIDEEGQSFDGRAVAIMRAEGKKTGSEHASGEGLALLVGTDRVPLDGAPVLLTGSYETRAAVVDLDDRARERFGRDGHVRLVSLAPGDIVRARGRLVRRAPTDGSAYRERESAWSLAPNDDSLELAYVGEPRVPRLSTKRLIVRGVFMAALVLGAVPFALSKAAQKIHEHGRGRISACEVDGIGPARMADRLFALVQSAPGWGPWAASERYDHVALVANAAAICSFDGVSYSVDAAVADYVLERLPALDAGRSVWGRSRVESFLHSIGRDDAIIALEARLSPSGEGDERVRAHLSRGDLEGAVRVWRTPGITSAQPILMTGPATVLCMAGDHGAALAAFDAVAPADWSRAMTLGRHAECLLRADRRRELAALLERMETVEHVELEIAYYRAELAARASDPDAVVALLGPSANHHSHHHLLLLHALVRAGRIPDAVSAFASGRLGDEIRRGDFGLEVYSSIFVPLLDLRRLRETAEALAASSVEGARAVAGELVLALAVRLARRWDSAADEEFELAAALLPDPTPAHRARVAMRVHHGDLDDLSGLSSDVAEAYRRLRDGEAPRWTHESRPEQQIKYPLLTLRATELIDAVALLGATQPPDALMALLRRQEGSRSLPATLLRLTLVITQGRRLRQDVSVEEARLAGLRRLLDAQPSPRLLEGNL